MFMVDEKIINATLAEILSSKYQLGTISEVVSEGAISDILIIYEGLRIVIDGGVDKRNFDKLIENTKEKLEQNYAIIGIVLTYPLEVLLIERSEDVKNMLSDLSYDVCILFWGKDGIEENRSNVNLDSLAKIIKNDVVSLLIKNDVISDLVKEVDNELTKLSKRMSERFSYLKPITDLIEIYD